MRKITAEDYARSLGMSLSFGINWDWAYSASKEVAEAFDNWCSQNGYETRGVYDPIESNDKWAVRFR